MVSSLSRFCYCLLCFCFSLLLRAPVCVTQRDEGHCVWQSVTNTGSSFGALGTAGPLSCGWSGGILGYKVRP